MLHSKDIEEGNAVFSDDRKYRYMLSRLWNKPNRQGETSNAKHIMFIGLNPSTANEKEDDPTIRRVVRFAKDWEYNGVYMMNLFAIVSANPKVLKQDPDPVGENDGWLETISGVCSDVLFAWGSFKEAEERAKKVSSMFPDALCLGVNKNGTPKHPLYIPARIKPVPFRLYNLYTPSPIAPPSS